LLHQVAEVQDLHALGELILQLVEERLVSRADHYNYPVENSSAWERLGKDAARWREVCNRLLDPQLSLERVNLTTLQREFPLRALKSKTPMFIGVGVTALLVGGLAVWLAVGRGKSKSPPPIANSGQTATTDVVVVRPPPQTNRPVVAPPPDTSGQETRLKQASADAAAAVKTGNWAAATNAYGTAFGLAQLLKVNTTSAQQGFNYASAMLSAQAAFDAKNYAEAISFSDRALAIRNSDVAATALRKNAQTGSSQLQQQQLAAQQQQQLQRAVNDAEAAVKGSNWAVATNAYGTAIGLAQLLKVNSTSAQQGLNYATAMLSAQAALDAKNYSEAISFSDRALVIRNSDVAATAIRKNAQDAANQLQQQQQIAQQQQQLQRSVDEAETAIKASNWAVATNAYGIALGLAKRLNVDTAPTQNGFNYSSAMVSAQAAFDGQKFAAAMPFLDQALTIRRGDPMATALQKRAREELTVVAPVQTNQPPVTGRGRPDLQIAGISFVWTSDLPLASGKGGYISKAEMTIKQYSDLMGKNPETRQRTNDTSYPVDLSLQEAELCCRKLMEHADFGKISTNLCVLPSETQYLAICGLKDGDFEGTNAVSRTAFNDLKQTENIGKGQVRPGTVQSAGTSPLRDLIGNVIEWTAEGARFGLRYNAEGESAMARQIMIPKSQSDKRYWTSVRPVLVPK